MVTQAKKQAIARYNAKTYTEIKFRMKKDNAMEFKQYLGDRSMNQFINQAIEEKIAKEQSEQ